MTTFKDWYVYMAECKDGSIYTGITVNVDKRIDAHNKGKGAKYTKTRRPIKLLCSWQIYADRGVGASWPNPRSEASKMESRIKKLSRREKLKLVEVRQAGGYWYDSKLEKEIMDEYKTYEPGFLKFLNELQEGTIIKFPNLFNKGRDATIMITYREDPGILGLVSPGCGCINYANMEEFEDKKYRIAEQHKTGFYPCQTFRSMRSWFKGNNYEIITKTTI